MAKNKGGNRPGEDGPYRPPNPADAPPYPPKKLAKKNKNKKGDPESEYSKPLPGAPSGHNIATNHGNSGHSTPGNSVNDNEHNYG